MSWETQRHLVQAEATKLEKSVKVMVKQESKLMTVLSWVLFICSFGRRKRDEFMADTAIALLHWIFIPREWSTESAIRVLPHECHHAKQQRWMGFGIHPAAGAPIALIVYVCLLFPFVLALGRAWMEINADQAKWKYRLSNNSMTTEQVLVDAQKRASRLWSKTYFWAIWPSLASKWCKWAAERVINGSATILG